MTKDKLDCLKSNHLKGNDYDDDERKQQQQQQRCEY